MAGSRCDAFLTEAEEDRDHGAPENERPGLPTRFLGYVGLVAVVIEMLSHAVAPNLLVHVCRQLHLHVAGVPLHVLRQVEACVGVRLPVKLQPSTGNSTR